MTRMLIMLVAGVVLFGASAAASFFLRPAPEETEAGNQAETTAVASPQTSRENAPMTTVTHHGEQQPGSLPAETVLRLNDAIRERERLVMAREKQLEQRERQLTFMIDDLQRERLEVSAMMEQAEKFAEQAQNMLRRVDREAPEIINQTDTSSGAATPTSELQAPLLTENLRTVSKVLQEMGEQEAADLIRQLSDDGKMDMAARLLDMLKERDAAKILSALGDSSLVAQLAGMMSQLPTETEE